MTQPSCRIVLNSVQIARGTAVVIPGLDLLIDGPGWFGLVGANGSGKTTLLRAIAGRLMLEEGKVILDGDDLTRDRAERARRIGYAVDPTLLPPELTPREIIALADPLPGHWDHGALDVLADALKITTLLDRRCKALSAGNLQRVAIFTAFLGLPRVVILDEPFNWLDPVVTLDLKDALSQMVVTQRMLLITALHDIATLTTRCSRAALLSQGQLVREFGVEDLRAAQTDPVAFERTMALDLR